MKKLIKTFIGGKILKPRTKRLQQSQRKTRNIQTKLMGSNSTLSKIDIKLNNIRTKKIQNAENKKEGKEKSFLSKIFNIIKKPFTKSEGELITQSKIVSTKLTKSSNKLKKQLLITRKLEREQEILETMTRKAVIDSKSMKAENQQQQQLLQQIEGQSNKSKKSKKKGQSLSSNILTSMRASPVSGGLPVNPLSRLSLLSSLSLFKKI